MLRWLNKLLPARRPVPARPTPEGVPDASIDESLRAAYREHQSGNLEQAADAYRSILRERPQHADALYLLGEIANRNGRYGEAVDLLRKSIAVNPRVAAFHYELGTALYASGESRGAVQSFRDALDLDPGHIDSHVDLAVALLALGMPAAAERSCRAALQIDPRSVAANVNLGAALEAEGKFAQAAESFRAALQIDPDCARALCNLSTVYLKLGDLEQAHRAVERAIRADPRLFEARLQHGSVFLELKRPEDAMRSFREAQRLRPDSAIAFSSLGCAFDATAQIERAMDCYERALALDPDCIQAHVNRAAVWLLAEDFTRGWREYEWRLRAPENAPAYERFSLPRWDGSSLEGRTILAYAEQGVGDQIMYASCLPDVIAQCRHCVIDCDSRLAPLFRRSFPLATVHGGTQSDSGEWLQHVPPVDLKVPVGSLPLYLRGSAAAFPRHGGYLKAAPERVGTWHTRLRNLGPGLKIGLSWRGGVPKTGRASRSLGLEQLLPLLRQEGLTFVSLQYGDCRRDLAQARQEHGVDIHHWQEAIDDYDETAALVCALDLTLSVCTAVVHLCGALGRPVWVMAPVRPESRYGYKGDSMRWYPSVRMFRQPAYGEWDSVIRQVGEALAALPRESGA